MTHDKFLSLLQDRNAAIEYLRQLEDDVDRHSENVFLQGRQEWVCMQELLELAKFAAGVSPGYVPGVTHGTAPITPAERRDWRNAEALLRTATGKSMPATPLPESLRFMGDAQ